MCRCTLGKSASPRPVWVGIRYGHIPFDFMNESHEGTCPSASGGLKSSRGCVELTLLETAPLILRNFTYRSLGCAFHHAWPSGCVSFPTAALETVPCMCPPPSASPGFTLGRKPRVPMTMITMMMMMMMMIIIIIMMIMIMMMSPMVSAQRIPAV